MNEVKFVDTTLRDGQLSLWASNMRTHIMLPIAEQIARGRSLARSSPAGKPVAPSDSPWGGIPSKRPQPRPGLRSKDRKRTGDMIEVRLIVTARSDHPENASIP